MPSSLKTIGSAAFQYCKLLENIIIPEGVETIEPWAFKGCGSLRDVKLPESLNEIQEEAFYNCKKLKSIIIPKGVTKVSGLGIVHSSKTSARSVLNFKIYGYEGSEAEKYVESLVENNYKIKFIKIKEGWIENDGKAYWYENDIKQGTVSDVKGVKGDGVVRGREIYDPVSDGWYWLDACFEGAKAESKEVWIPYIYQDESEWSENEMLSNALNSPDMQSQVSTAIKNQSGKWVRYDSAGKMIKGWYTVEGEDAAIYPQQAGNTYYYDSMTGLMAKGKVTIDGVEYNFDEITGVLTN